MMLKIRRKNLFVVLFLLFSLTLTYGCSSTIDEETMKKTIADKYYSRDDMRNFHFTQFKIKNRLNMQKHGENYHCVLVENAYVLERLNITTETWTPFNFDNKTTLYCFVKRGDVWNVKEEGEIL